MSVSEYKSILFVSFDVALVGALVDDKLGESYRMGDRVDGLCDIYMLPMPILGQQVCLCTVTTVLSC